MTVGDGGEGWRTKMLTKVELKDAIMDSDHIAIGDEDAWKISDWAIDGGCGDGGQNLLLIGRTGSGKSVLIQTLWPLFAKPANHFNCRWEKLKEYAARPMIIDHTNLGLSKLLKDRDPDKRKLERAEVGWIASLNECEGPLLVTSFSDLAGLRGDWLRIELNSWRRMEEAGHE